MRFACIKYGIKIDEAVGLTDNAARDLAGLFDHVIPLDEGQTVEFGATWDGATFGPTISSHPLVKQRVFDAAIGEGFAVNPEGFTLALDDDSRQQWVALRSHLSDGLDLGLITGESPVIIHDIADEPHTLTVTRLRQILFAGGQYYQGLLAAVNS